MGSLLAFYVHQKPTAESTMGQDRRHNVGTLQWLALVISLHISTNHRSMEYVIAKQLVAGLIGFCIPACHCSH